MAKYVQIQEFIKEKYGWNVQSCHIAHVKDIHGIVGNPAPNRISLDARAKKCPKTKIPWIEDALRHFGMLTKG